MEKIIRLKNFYAAAFVCVKLGNDVLINHYRENGSTVFEFQNSTELQQLLDDLYNLKTLVEPMTYSYAIKNLKSIIHNSRAIESYLLSTHDTEDLNNGFNNKSGEKLQ